jgi:hypothetical protein
VYFCSIHHPRLTFLVSLPWIDIYLKAPVISTTTRKPA